MDALKVDSPEERYRQRLARISARMSRQIDLTFHSNPFRSLNKRFAILCGGRTGSYLLCEQLLPYGAFATECFQEGRVLGVCKQLGLTRLQDYCEQYLGKNAVGGVLGVKGEFDSFLPPALAGEFPDHLDDWRFVHLRRIDTLKQAVSFVIAEQTSAWRSFIAPERALTDDDYDASRIAKRMETMSRTNGILEETLTLFGIEPLRITYEELAADPPGVSATVAAYLDLKGPPIGDRRFVKPPMERQSSELNARWEARFLEERRSETSVTPL